MNEETEHLLKKQATIVDVPAQYKRRNHSLNRKFFMRLWTLIKLSVVKFFSWGVACVFLLLAANLAEIYTVRLVGHIPGDFYSALVTALHSDKKAKPFLITLGMGTLWILLASLVKTLQKFFEESMENVWRKNLTQNFQSRYFKNNLFYNMLLIDKSVDNT